MAGGGPGCKGGKGRTGLMICAYLLYSGLQDNAEAVLKFYASKRTFDSNGVTQPSQRSCVSYFAAKLAYSPVRLVLRALRLWPPPHLRLHWREAHLQLHVHQKLAPHFDSEVFTVYLTSEEIVLDLPHPLILNGDMKIALSQKFNMDPLKLGSWPTMTLHGPHAKLCHFWVNTCFLALGHSCPLSHTVADDRGRTDSSSPSPPPTDSPQWRWRAPCSTSTQTSTAGCWCDWTRGRLTRPPRMDRADFAVELVLGPWWRAPGSRPADGWPTAPGFFFAFCKNVIFWDMVDVDRLCDVLVSEPLLLFLTYLPYDCWSLGVLL